MKLQKIYLFALSAICAQSGIVCGMETGLGKQEAITDSSKSIWLSFNDETYKHATPAQLNNLLLVSAYLSRSYKSGSRYILIPCAGDSFKKVVAVMNIINSNAQPDNPMSGAIYEQLIKLSDDDFSLAYNAARKLEIQLVKDYLREALFEKLVRFGENDKVRKVLFEDWCKEERVRREKEFFDPAPVNFDYEYKYDSDNEDSAMNIFWQKYLKGN